jgi:hypothetical protein
VTSSYADAAFEVLARQGSPLHYEVIAKAAVELGILSRRAKRPDIVFSSTLSRLSRSGIGPFRKRSLGVYELASQFSIQGIKGADECGTRLAVLRVLTGVRDDVAILNKGLYLLRNALSLAGHKFIVEIGSAGLPFRLKPATAHQLSSVIISAPCQMTSELLRPAARLRADLEAREVLHVVGLSLALLQTSIEQATGSQIVFRMGGKQQSIPVF